MHLRRRCFRFNIKGDSTTKPTYSHSSSVSEYSVFQRPLVLQKDHTRSYPAQLYSLLSTHIRTFLHLGQCHAGCSPKAEGISIVCRVKNPRIPFFARSVSEVNSYQLSKPAPTHSVTPCSISAPQSRHCMVFSSVLATFPSSRLLYIPDPAQNDFQKINIIGQNTNAQDQRDRSSEKACFFYQKCQQKQAGNGKYKHKRHKNGADNPNRSGCLLRLCNIHELFQQNFQPHIAANLLVSAHDTSCLSAISAFFTSAAGALKA